MDELLGLLLLAGFIVVIVVLAAAVTFAVVKIFPTERKPKNPDKQDSAHPPASTDGGGKLFRRSKRATP